MSLISRKPRPIPREEGKLRDARLFVVATEDTYGPKNYFALFKHPRIHVEVLNTDLAGKSNPEAVVDRLAKFVEAYQLGPEDQLWALLDTDHWISGAHKAGLIQAIQEARRLKCNVAMSRPCFELWLLLHHEDVAPEKEFKSCEEVGSRIREILGEFSKVNLKAEHYTPSKMEMALKRAKKLDQQFASVAGADFWPEQTATRVYRLIEQFEKAGLMGAGMRENK